MAKRRRAPGDTTAAANRTTTGTTTDTALGGFPVDDAPNVTLVITAATFVNTASPGDAGTAKVQYQFDGGGWIDVAALTSSASGGASDSASGTESVDVGSVADLSTFDVRASAEATVVDTVEADSSITDWYLRIPVGIILGG